MMKKITINLVLSAILILFVVAFNTFGQSSSASTSVGSGISTSGLTLTGNLITTDPWVDPRSYTSFNDTIDNIDTDNETIIISETQAVTSDKTVPSNITLKFLQGGSLSINSGITLTINGTIEAPYTQIFSGDGSVIIGGNQEVWSSWWGSVNNAVDSGAKITRIEPNKTYTISSSISLDDNQSLIGSDWTSVLQADSGMTSAIITNQDTTNGNSNVTIKDLKVFGNGESCPAIQFSGTQNSDILIENCWTDYNYDKSILLENIHISKILNSKITRFGSVLTDGDGTAPTEDAIRLIVAHDCEINGNYIDNSGLIADQHADNQTYGRHGIYLSSDTSGAVNIVTNNIIKTVERSGIELESSADKIIIANNKIYDAGTWGVYAVADYSKIVSNHIEDAGQAGVLVGGDDSGYNLVSSNTVLNSGKDVLTGNTSSEYISGIVANASSKYYQIIGNTIVSSSDFGIYLRRSEGLCANNSVISNGSNGIQIISDNWSVTGNKSVSNTSHGINVNGANAVVNSNQILSNGGYGLEVSSNASNGSYLGNLSSGNTSADVHGYNDDATGTFLSNQGSNVFHKIYMENGFQVYGDTALGRELLQLSQNDEDEAFIDFDGTSAADLTKNITTLSSGTVTGHVKIEVDGSVRWIPYVSTPQ